MTRLPPGRWQWFTQDHDEDDAARRYAAKFGVPPEQVMDYERWLVAWTPGQVPQEDER